MFIVELREDGISTSPETSQLFLDEDVATVAFRRVIADCTENGLTIVGTADLADGIEVYMDSGFSAVMYRHYPSTMLH